MAYHKQLSPRVKIKKLLLRHTPTLLALYRVTLVGAFPSESNLALRSLPSECEVAH